MPSPELPEAFLPLRPFTTAGGGCATLSVQESFWFAQPSRQGWLGLLLVFMTDGSLSGEKCARAEAQLISKRFAARMSSCPDTDRPFTQSHSLFFQISLHRN